jgi:hypothetical protein
VLWKEGGSARITLKFPHGEADVTTDSVTDSGANTEVTTRVAKTTAVDGGLFTVHDPVSGNGVEMTTEAVLRVGRVPVFVTWQGATGPEIE